MKKLLSLLLSVTLLSVPVAAQTIPTPPPQTTQDDEELVRITSELVQTDAIVVDKNEQVVTDLKLDEFEIYDNGKRQDLKFIEFVSTDAGRRIEGQRPGGGGLPASVANDVARDLSAADLKRVFAFVVDDLTIPFEDMVTVRRVLRDFVDNQMRPGDLVSIVRSVGGKGMLQQFTSDKALLRRAISTLNVVTNPYAAFNNPSPEPLRAADYLLEGEQSEVASSTVSASTVFDTADNLNELSESSANDQTRTLRAFMSLTTANYVVDSLAQLPGRKNLVLFSGGLPIYQMDQTGNFSGNISFLLRQLTDNAARAGVAINTMDVQGLKGSEAVKKFTETPATSALGPNTTPGQGRLPDESVNPTLNLGQFEGQQGLRALANDTGGVAIVNTNDFKAGLDKVINRSSSYYILAYTPSQKFDNKFHKVQVKVKRSGLKVYTRAGYVAREEQRASGARTKEQTIVAAALSPLAKRDIDLTANVTLKPLTANKTEVGIHMLIDPKKLSFTEASDGKHQTSFDIAGFIVDELGKTRGGFSETVNLNLTPEEYRRVLASGITYSANTELPAGYFQLRAVVRETTTGALGTMTRYMEMPDLSKGRLTMSSLFLYAVNPQSSGGTAPQVEPLLALRQLSRRHDLRYAAIISNPKLSKGTPQVRSQVIISQGSNVIYREPEQPVPPPANSSSPMVKIGQLGISKIRPGRYMLTLVVTDPLADKKNQTLSRSLDFTVVE